MEMKHELYCVLFATFCFLRCSMCISNTQFNANIREYSVNDNNGNTTNQIKTLQKEESRKHFSFGPDRASVVFKEIPDNALSSTSHGRGLLDHDRGYVIAEYDELPPYAHGHDYPVHIPDPHVFEAHYNHHDPGYHHHLNHGHHYKHYNHALAAKTLLWPIAGIALLGAAAALVSNPVLLQLGVVSGKRKKRNANDEAELKNNNPYKGYFYYNKIITDHIDNDKVAKDKARDVIDSDSKQRMLRWKLLKDKRSKTTPTNNIKTLKDENIIRNDDRYIPVPLQIKHL